MPVSVAALIVTGAVPVDASVKDCVEVIFNATLPKATLFALILNVDVPGFNCKAKLSDTLPAVAVNVAVWAVLTAETFAVNPALVEPEATVTEGGTVAAALLLDRLIVNPPLWAAAVSVRVQESVAVPVIDPLLHDRALSAGIGLPGEPVVPVPPKLTTAVDPVEELLVMVSCPAANPVAAGSNCTFRVSV